jgi:hypothetical protein
MVVENIFLPALARGFVESTASISGYAVYRLTQTGQAWLAGPAPQAVPECPVDPEYARIYSECIEQAIDALATEKPVCTRELGLFPSHLVAGCPITSAEDGSHE